jgi:hypothetical protein
MAPLRGLLIMNLPEIIYEKDDYADILKKDGRFDSRAYDFVLEVINHHLVLWSFLPPNSDRHTRQT